MPQQSSNRKKRLGKVITSDCEKIKNGGKAPTTKG